MLYPKLAWGVFRQICDAADIPCRPGSARMHYRAGTKLPVIAKLLGHSRTTTREHYLGLKGMTPTTGDVAQAETYFATLNAQARRTA